MSAPKVDVHGILERAGADPDAPEGSQAWALAQVDATVAQLIEAAKCGDPVGMSDGPDALYFQPLLAERLLAALANVGGQP